MARGNTKGHQSSVSKSSATAGEQLPFAVSAPSLSLPKGGGAIHGIGEKFSANAATGTGSMSVPIATSPGRSGFGPLLALSYDSGAGNGPFGFGWSLTMACITCKTDKGLPRYLASADADSDVYVLSGTEDLVRVLVQDAAGAWKPLRVLARTVGGSTYRIDRYRPRIEGLFARIERWTNDADPRDVFWRSISKANVTTWYGRTAESRIADPEDPSRIFSWLICESHDDKGNALVYGYKPEDSADVFVVDPSGTRAARAHERNRTDKTRGAQRYLKRIRYGNRAPYFPELKAAAAWPEPPDARAPDGSAAWLFEVVLDYGEHDALSSRETATWPARPDPFSSYRAGFEIRTYRICRRALMFHHFADEANVGRDCLVHSTDFGYSHQRAPENARNPVHSLLKVVTQTGYRRGTDGYDRRSLPSIEFDYSEPTVSELVEEIDPQGLPHLPGGPDGDHWRWTDLHGEGLPGLLAEQAGGWHYWRNLSALTNRARLAALETVALKPNTALARGAEFMDLAGNGQPDVVVMDGPVPGLYEHDDAEGWQAFRPFSARLNRDWRDRNVKFVDLDGDGHADVLITETDAFVWHASLTEEGFGPAKRVAHALTEEAGPRVVFADATESIHLADMSGDGLGDIVRIRCGEVCYWPNLGYGRFGAKVTMDNPPRFDHADQYDARRLRLADIDGSGTTDLIYLHGEGVRLYFNQSGNAWSAPQALRVFPRVDDVVNILPLDLLGNGTTCLVWSSPLCADAPRALRYVNLMSEGKPHLLVKAINNLGGETRIAYAPSTKFYLQDRRDGKPWLTRLPFPVQVVERVETIDHVGRNRFVTRYAYHHGHFDGEEREFRGFGMVEQWDTAQWAALADGQVPPSNSAAASHVPAVHTRTWFHTGVYADRHHVSDHFAGLQARGGEGEYFREPGLGHAQALAQLLPDTVLPAGLTADEEREACRALKGSVLRQEVYADDADSGASAAQILRARMPYAVTEHNATIRMLQPRGGGRHAVFFTHACETLSYHYERDPVDPRVQHALTLDVDDFGNVLKQVAIGYGRRASTLPEPWDRERQTTTLLTYTDSRFTRDHDQGTLAIDRDDAFRAPMPCEVVNFELTGYVASGTAGRYQASDFVEPDPDEPGQLRQKFTDEVPYESAPTAAPCRRPIEHLRTLYRRDDLSALLPVGHLQPLALHGESYKLAFTPGLIDQVFVRPMPGQADEPLLPAAQRAATLGGQGSDSGGYVDLDGNGHWWVPSGRAFHHADDVTAAQELAEARAHFFFVRRLRDAFGNEATVTFDGPADPAQPRYDLIAIETRDALGNRVTVDAMDYRLLKPRAISDPNRNRTEAAFDILGMVVATAVRGKPAPAAAEGDAALDGFDSDLEQDEIDDFFDAADLLPAAAELLAGATTRTVYDLERFRRTREAAPDDPTAWQPARVATLTREHHVHGPLPAQGLKIQVGISYSDGFGREVQRKIQAEPGPLDIHDPQSPVVTPRWVGSGWTIFNNKGKPVRQYEPFFSATHGFEFAAVAGVSAVLFYDPVERVVVTLHPNHTYEKLVLDAWQQTSYDVNDTCAARNAQTGDPRTDPDIQGYVAEYFKALPADPAKPWQTWQAQRLGNALGAHEGRAAERAAAHADTPTALHFDALGRSFLTIARNRVACTNHPLDARPDEEVRTRIALDIEGNQREVRDERRLPDAQDLPLGAVEQRVVMRYAYDMLGHRIHQLSMEAGERWVLNDVAGQPIRAWDSRGHDFSTAYDLLRRPVEQRVRGTSGESDPRTRDHAVLFDKIEYGEALPNAEELNVRTRVFRHFDSAGVVTYARLDGAGQPLAGYDFKGNLLFSTRQLASDYKTMPDWRLPAAPQLAGEAFESGTRYDALDRAIQSVAPHSSVTRAGHPDKFNVVQAVFNESNLLARLDLWLERAAPPPSLIDAAVEAPSPVGVAGIRYDAKGQRTLIDYKTRDDTVTRTVYAYEAETFRLARLYTRRGVAAGAPPDGAFVDGLQNLSYTYDAAGNICHVHDDAQQTVYFRNQRVEPANDYIFDALYRLVQAQGREHLGQAASGERLPPTAPDGFNAFHARLEHPGNGNAMGTYTERYVYDAVGNFLQMQHRGSDPVHPGWTRVYAYAEPSLIEAAKHGNRLSHTRLVSSGAAAPPETCLHDVHGNLTRLPHLGLGAAGPNMDWDYKDRLMRVDLGGGGAAFYMYDSAGQRVRKVVEKAAGLVEERLYLGGFEVYREHGGAIGADTAKLERETLHVMDDQQRVAVVETRTLDTAGNDLAPRQLVRYQHGNHLGSASLELDDEAQIVSYEEYSPYGSSTHQAVRSKTETAKRYRYTGKERDEESGLHYHGARYYAAWLGRWVSVDPLLGTIGHSPRADEMAPSKSLPRDENESRRTPPDRDAPEGFPFDAMPRLEAYVYASCNPVVQIDPDGNAPVKVGTIYTVRATLDGEEVVYSGQTSRELAQRLLKDRHKWGALIKSPTTTIEAHEVTAELNVSASSRGTLASAKKEALSAAEQVVVKRRRVEGIRELNSIEAAEEANIVKWADRHNVRLGARTTFRAGVKLSVNAWLVAMDLLMMYRDMKLEQYVMAPYVLDDERGAFTFNEQSGGLFHKSHYFKNYKTGDLAGQRVEVSEDEFNQLVDEAKALWGTTDWKGDFVPGILRRELPVIDVCGDKCA